MFVHQANKQEKKMGEIKHLFNVCDDFSGEEGHRVPAAWLAEPAGHATDAKLVCLVSNTLSLTHCPPCLHHTPAAINAAGSRPGNKPALVAAVTAGVILMVVCVIDCF